MGRNLQQANSTIIGKSRPSTGCMWGVLHILKYQQWRHIKKRLPYRRGASNKQAVDMQYVEADLEGMTSPPLPSIIDSLEDQLIETISKDTPTAEKIDILSKHLTILVGAKEKAEFDYVRDILEISGFSGTELLGTWHSNNQPMDPCLFEEMEEDCMVLDPECSGNVEGYRCNHLLLFDLINEVLMEIYAKSYTYYPRPLSALSHIRPMPVGQHVLEEVWANMSWYLSSIPEADQLLDHIVSGDLAKSDGWMNLQFDSECAGLEVEDLIFDDLLEEVIFT
ncbi:hypothetical protein GH714_010417 [Hevea brasiliensis]|uniref:DUF4378 domain-containing protein n=1 Tax=Hevea brasiliensis TaxID=3981 RepID=A0A6A6KIG0_HEVBR|nr:hypothetical protein GH714_010417 [Hevea brasiliensis]